jgi:2-isopropylmalate synthase
MKARKIAMYDTTLRDGAQAEGISFSAAGKIKLARRLDAFGIDYIEGGYAGSNPREMEFFEQIRRQPLAHAQIVAFGSTRRAGRSVKQDPFTQSLLKAHTKVVTIYGKAWFLHVRDCLRTTAKENFAMIADTVRFLKDHGRTVFFDAEHFFDGYRDSAGFALQALHTARDAGADMLVLCDTNGGSLTEHVAEASAAAIAAFGGAHIGIHTHNDTGLAVANALAAVRAGASQVQGTINGYGERCGNADLCTAIAALQIKAGCRCVPPRCLRELRELSLFTDDLVNQRPNPRAPFVGASAFSHKAGAHVNAVRKTPRSFEHVRPEDVGNERQILVSELSGSSNVLLKAIELGAEQVASGENAAEVLQALKRMEAKGYAFEGADASFRLLIEKALKKHRPYFDLEGYRVIVEKRGHGSPCLSEATVKLRVQGELEQTVAEGDGPVDALNRALRRALTRFYPAIARVSLTDFRVRILDPEEATAAKTRVTIESTDGADTWSTVGVSENLIEASWEALVDSVEYTLFRHHQPQRKRAARRPARMPAGR